MSLSVQGIQRVHRVLQILILVYIRQDMSINLYYLVSYSFPYFVLGSARDVVGFTKKSISTSTRISQNLVNITHLNQNVNQIVKNIVIGVMNLLNAQS